MCGIAGLLDFSGAAVNAETLLAMNSRLVHRGPDAEGSWIHQNVGLAHRRLSIVDLSPLGRQPMANEDETVWIVFNGEIYNHPQLRGELLACGHRFRSNTDTEVILHLYEEVGAGVAERLSGMFAFAIYDLRAKRLLLARDRVGKKPLFYTFANSVLHFASEVQAILADPAVPRRPNLQALADYLTFQCVPGDTSAFQGVERVPPASVVMFDSEGNKSARKYWFLDYRNKVDLTDVEAVEQLDQLLLDATGRRMVADVPLGAFLSGGIDSSLVVAAMARQSSRPVRTFSMGFKNERLNELPFARLVAQAYGTDHTEILLEPESIDVLPHLVRHYGEPFADPSALATHALAKMTGEHVTVALSGDGGDEAFAGYERYMVIQRLTRLLAVSSRVSGSFNGILRPSSGLAPWSMLRRIRSGLDLFTGDEALRYLSQMAFFREYEKDFLLTNDVKAEISRDNAVAWLRRLFLHCNATDPVDRMTAVDVLSYLPDDILVKVDIASMANSLETRSPFLDHEVLEFGASLPPRLRFSRGEGKRLPRLLARRLLPPVVIDRPKQGFAVPIRDWFRSDCLPYLEDVLLDDRSLARGYFEPHALRSIISAHASGRANLEYRLWALLNLELWHREFIDG